MSIRATEYTVGKAGPTSMPATLPPSSGYTYAVELSADEAIAVGASTVTFSKPVVLHVDNFLGFPVGSAVPTGYYDREKGVWVASKNGRVIQVLSIGMDGKAALDIDGDGAADGSEALAALGIDDEELGRIGADFAAGKSLWRAQIPHLTPWDCNWPYGPPKDAVPPPSPPNGKKPVDDPDRRCGSIIGCQDQTLGEVLPIAGTPWALHYSSGRVPGRNADRTVIVPLSDSSLPASLQQIRVEVRIAGRLYTASFAPAPYLTYKVVWDGEDAFGRKQQGAVTATTTVYYDYALQYYSVQSDWEQSFARAEAIDGSTMVLRNGRTGAGALQRTWTQILRTWDASAAGLGGWTVNVHHQYDPGGRRLLLGDGTQRSVQGLERVVVPVAGSSVSGFSGDDGPATAATLAAPCGLAWGSDGSLFISTLEDHRVRRVGPDGIITTVAGTGEKGSYEADGGPARLTKLSNPCELAVGRDGSLFISEGYYSGRVRRLGLDGIITTVAGTGDPSKWGHSGDGGPAALASFNPYPGALAVGADGSLFIGEYGRARRVGPDGVINTVAGTGESGYAGDGGPATAARMSYSPRALAVRADGSLLIADALNFSVRRVGPDGIISTVAGIGENGSSGDGSLATAARLSVVTGLAVGPDDTLFIAEAGNKNNGIRRLGPDGMIARIAGIPGLVDARGEYGPALAATLFPSTMAIGADEILYFIDGATLGSQTRVRAIAPALPGANAGDLTIASADGAEIYLFDSAGRHLKTIGATTRAVRYFFGYDAAGYLISVTDAAGNVTKIERNGAMPTAILAPFGQRTALSLDTNGWLATATDPDGAIHGMDYTAEGLLQHVTDPRGYVHTFTYEPDGRLSKDEDPAGGSTTLARTEQSQGYTVTTTSALDRAHSYQVESLSTGETRRTSTAPSGAKSVTILGGDGSEQTTFADGSSLLVKKGPDPRWGMLAPMVQSAVTTTPVRKLTSTITTTRDVTLSILGNPWSMTALTDMVSVNSNKWVSSYDATRRQVTRTSPMGRTSVTTLDDKGRVVGLSVSGLAPVTVAYDDKGRPWTVTQGDRQTVLGYDAQGYLNSIAGPLSRTIRLENDAMGRMAKQTGADGSEMSFGYDPSSNITSVTPPGRSAYIFGYSAIDQETSFTPPSVDKWDSTISYTFDKDRALSNVTMPNGANIGMTYDSAGRVKQMDYPQGTTKLDYDPTTGQLSSASNSTENLTWGYDGPLVTSATLTGAVSGAVGYTYNNDFRLATTTVNGGSTASFDYDDDGLLTSAGGVTLRRDPDNGLLRGTTAGTVTEGFDYNTYGEMTSYAAKAGSTELLAVTYVPDALGRLQQKVETIGGATTTYDYGYDAASRLHEVKQNGVVVRNWDYDQAGNRKSETKGGTTVTATYDVQDRLQTYGAATYTFGKAGDLQSRTEGTKATSYVYDVLGNLISAQLPDGTQLDYVVDARGRRVGKKVNGKLVQGFLWESQLRVAAELDGSGKVVSRFVYGTKVNVPELIIKGSTTYRVITDHLGSPRLVVNAADGTVAQRIDYDEWGNVLADSQPGFQPFGFAGGLYDRDLGVVRFGARDYEPTTGRWTAKDPARFAGGSNFYAYAANNPLKYIDPNGLYLVAADADAQGLMDRLRMDPSGAALMDYLEASPNVYNVYGNAVPPATVSKTTSGIAGNAPGESRYEACGGKGLDVRLFRDRAEQNGVNPVVNLGHELGHAAMYDLYYTGRSGLPSFLEGYLPYTLPGQPNGMQEIPHNVIYANDIANRWGGL